MKKTKNILLGLIAIFCFALNGNAQSWSSTWALTSDGVASTSGNITAGNVTGGPGIGTISYSSTSGIYANSFDSTMLCPRDFFQFTMNPTSGYNLSVTSLSFYYSVPWMQRYIIR